MLRDFNLPTAFNTISVFCAVSIMAVTMGSSALAHSDHEKMAPGKTLAQVIAGTHRSDKNKSRDQYRHPKATLEFFGLKSDMSVVEIWPGGGGWYQEIIAPYLNAKGTYYSAGNDLAATGDYTKKTNAKIAARLASDKTLYGNAVVTELAPPAKVEIAPAGSVDMVVSFRNFHNWQMAGSEKTVVKAAYDALKPGGIFGITDHRSDNPKERDGYIKPSYLLKVAKEAGFVLVAKSEINANPKDSHDHVKGVWTLLPRLAGDKADHDKMRAIGESDRLTFKFMKPAK